MAKPPGVSWCGERKAWYTTSLGEERRTKTGRKYRTKVWNREIAKGDRVGAMGWLRDELKRQDRERALIAVTDPTFEWISECYLASAEKVGNLAPESRVRAEEALSRFGEWPRHDSPHRMHLRRAREIGVDDLQRFVADLLRQRLSEAYVVDSLVRTVKACFSWASRVRPGEYAGLPLPSNAVAAYEPPRKPRRADRHASPVQVDAFLAWDRRRIAKLKRRSASKRFAINANLLLLTLRETGGRPKELCSAEWAEWSVRPDGWGAIKLPWSKWKNGEKTKRDRLILVPPRCARRIERVKASPSRHPTHLFAHRTNRPGPADGNLAEIGIPWVADYRSGSTKLLQVWFQRLRKRAIREGVDLPAAFRLYWFRTLYSTEAQRKGSNKAVLAKTMGTSERMLDLSYTDLEFADMIALAKQVSGQPGTINPGGDGPSTA